MTRTGAFLLAAWVFVVGDDWRTAIGVALAIALTAMVAAIGIPAWWIMPLSVLALIARSTRRAARRASR